MKRRNLWFIIIAFFVVSGSIIWYLASDFEFTVHENKIGVVEIKGAITNSQEAVKAIKQFRKDASVKVILLRIDSPGGAVGPSQEIYREIRRTRATKPVVASLGSVAASGGYYIAAAANRIVSNPGTVTGSIGVISYFPRLQGLFEKIGYGMTTIKSGEYKDIGNPSREMTPEEKALMQASIDETHSQFVRDVAEGRKLTEEKVREIADGRIIIGSVARDLGLVDELGNFEDAVDAAVTLGAIDGEPNIVYAKKKRVSMMDLFLGSDMEERLNGFLENSYSPLRYQLPFSL